MENARDQNEWQQPEISTEGCLRRMPLGKVDVLAQQVGTIGCRGTEGCPVRVRLDFNPLLNPLGSVFNPRHALEFNGEVCPLEQSASGTPPPTEP